MEVILRLEDNKPVWLLQPSDNGQVHGDVKRLCTEREQKIDIYKIRIKHKTYRLCGDCYFFVIMHTGKLCDWSIKSKVRVIASTPVMIRTQAFESWLCSENMVVYLDNTPYEHFFLNLDHQSALHICLQIHHINWFCNKEEEKKTLGWGGGGEHRVTKTGQVVSRHKNPK